MDIVTLLANFSPRSVWRRPHKRLGKEINNLIKAGVGSILHNVCGEGLVRKFIIPIQLVPPSLLLRGPEGGGGIAKEIYEFVATPLIQPAQPGLEGGADRKMCSLQLVSTSSLPKCLGGGFHS